ncbi:MAG: MauE/DoxX family redox-associated membrane protein [Elusimicrobiota bacterium]
MKKASPLVPGSPVGAASRILVGAVLLYSGLQKSAVPAEEFASIIDFYRLLPEGYSLVLASVLPALEVLVGLALVTGYLCRYAALAGGSMSLMFIGALGSTIFRGIPLPDCGCFGKLVHLTPWQAVGLDSGLVCLSYLAYRSAHAYAWVDSWVERGTE